MCFSQPAEETLQLAVKGMCVAEDKLRMCSSQLAKGFLWLSVKSLCAWWHLVMCAMDAQYNQYAPDLWWPFLIYILRYFPGEKLLTQKQDKWESIKSALPKSSVRSSLWHEAVTLKEALEMDDGGIRTLPPSQKDLNRLQLDLLYYCDRRTIGWRLRRDLGKTIRIWVKEETPWQVGEKSQEIPWLLAFVSLCVLYKYKSSYQRKWTFISH